MKIARRQFTRKEMLKMSLLGAAALALPLERTARTQLSLANRIPESQLPAPFTVPFGVPKVARPVKRTATTDVYQMVSRSKKLQILPDFPKTEVWGYDGETPGKTILARRGRNVKVRHINQIRTSRTPGHRHISVHLHGNASLPQYDGYASDTIKPGFYKDYYYPNEQDARTLWYHDHGFHDTAINAYMGCAAFYITYDNLERSLPIPKGYGRYDIPLVLRDAIFSQDGQLVFDDQGHSSLMGDMILANGRPWPVMKVERRKYRFRILNAAISRGFNLALSTGEPMTVIGTDGGLMPAPVLTQTMKVGMAERYEVVIDFAKYPIGEQVVLQNLGVKNSTDFPNTDKIMRFDVVSDATDRQNNAVPDVLNPQNPVMRLRESQAKPVRRELNLHRSNGEWKINNQTWHDVIESGYKRVLANPGLGDVEIWNLRNNSGGWFHPLHLHLVDFKVLSRNGRPPRPYERGPKDTVYLGEGELIRVLMKFEKKGKYMVHCHNLVHEDHDMMAQYEVGRGGPDPLSARARKVSNMRPL